MTTAYQTPEATPAAPAVGTPVDRQVKALAPKRTDAQEVRRLKLALRELSDSVLVFLHWMDSTVGPNKELPRELSTKLGKVCTFLDMQNDGARRFHLGLSITAEAKLKAARELRKLGAL
jgi:hypothetical protein